MSEGPDRQGRAAGGRITSVRQLGGSVRRRLSRHPLAETGLIVAGDAILSPATGADAGGGGVPTGSEAAVRTEGAAAAGGAARGTAVTV